ncbi:Glycosyl transferase family 2 [Chryseobacterium oranimense]|uniref:Glycosyl transferase family 2 n=1 Tax=Chryseobacterium oranimense TaxID=421058 RepID=A0A1M5P6M1_9FLAO|nr:glycosyltransferase family 2 protein [Chryseobacterium oranimense]SHG97440.1 Glycosyl transferase family 2 [Chryseobacterium oranimense]
MTLRNHQNKLAIVIPYYKIDFFEETIKSVAAQTNKNFVLYIGNDASPNDPISIIEKYLQPESYFYFSYKDNLGGKNLALQWERILENVKEEWFQILGDDDMISENFVEEFYKNIQTAENKNISVIKFVHEWIDENNKHIETFDYKVDILNAVEFIIKKYKGLVKSSLSENIFKTKMYYKFRFEKIPLAWGSDEIALLSFSNYKDILYCHNSKVLVRISGSSISGSETMDQRKKAAYNHFRELIIIKHSKYFPASFIHLLISDYLNYCHYNGLPANYKVALYNFRNLHFMQFLKNIRKIYYLNQMYKLKQI